MGLAKPAAECGACIHECRDWPAWIDNGPSRASVAAVALGNRKKGQVDEVQLDSMLGTQRLPVLAAGLSGA